jgi:hypothetical protein
MATWKTEREVSKESGPASTLILVFKPPKLQKNKSPLFISHQFVVFRYSNSCKLIQCFEVAYKNPEKAQIKAHTGFLVTTVHEHT